MTTGIVREREFTWRVPERMGAHFFSFSETEKFLVLSGDRATRMAGECFIHYTVPLGQEPNKLSSTQKGQRHFDQKYHCSKRVACSLSLMKAIFSLHRGILIKLLLQHAADCLKVKLKFHQYSFPTPEKPSFLNQHHTIMQIVRYSSHCSFPTPKKHS